MWTTIQWTKALLKSNIYRTTRHEYDQETFKNTNCPMSRTYESTDQLTFNCLPRIIGTKGRVRIRKSKSGEKWNVQLVNDVYVVTLYRCCTSKLCSYKCQILHNWCALKRDKWLPKAFLPKLTHFKDFKCIFQYQRTPALVILFQHTNNHGDLCY